MVAPDRPTATSGYVDAGGVHTDYEARGAGDPVVMLHGGFATLDTWEAQAAALAERYRVILPERRGHGRTPDVDGPMTYEAMAGDTIAFMDALGVGPAHVVGWSDGASVALYVARRRPDMVRKLISMSAPAWYDGLRPAAKAFAQNLSVEHMPASLVEAYIQLSPDGPDHISVVIEKLRRMWSSEPQMSVSDLKAIAAPTLVILGDDDVLTVEHAATMAASLPDAQLAVVPGTDHGLMFEKPDLISRLFLDFLADDQPPKLMS